ncbi:hypothetical protein HY949_00440 [Candidatus Gottesmanbacteria bacterium]|nr:hypothetical protein [Candidatus Gottesmanbacteria bacterium]
MSESKSDGSHDPEDRGVFAAEKLPPDIEVRTLEELKARGGFTSIGTDDQGKPVPIAVQRISRMEQLFNFILNRK